MRVRNISWRSHPTLQTIYGDLPRVSQVVQSRRVQFAGHAFRATNEVVSPLILWKSQSVGCRSRKLTYPDVIASCVFDIDCGRKMMMMEEAYHFFLQVVKYFHLLGTELLETGCRRFCSSCCCSCCCC